MIWFTSCTRQDNNNLLFVVMKECQRVVRQSTSVLNLWLGDEALFSLDGNGRPLSTWLGVVVFTVPWMATVVLFQRWEAYWRLLVLLPLVWMPKQRSVVRPYGRPLPSPWQAWGRRVSSFQLQFGISVNRQMIGKIGNGTVQYLVLLYCAPLSKMLSLCLSSFSESVTRKLFEARCLAR